MTDHQTELAASRAENAALRACVQAGEDMARAIDNAAEEAVENGISSPFDDAKISEAALRQLSNARAEYKAACDRAK